SASASAAARRCSATREAARSSAAFLRASIPLVFPLPLVRLDATAATSRPSAPTLVAGCARPVSAALQPPSPGEPSASQAVARPAPRPGPLTGQRPVSGGGGAPARGVPWGGGWCRVRVLVGASGVDATGARSAVRVGG